MYVPRTMKFTVRVLPCLWWLLLYGTSFTVRAFVLQKKGGGKEVLYSSQSPSPHEPIDLDIFDKGNRLRETIIVIFVSHTIQLSNP